MVDVALLLLFLAHLVAFATLGIRRRQAYYAALVVTFALLSATMALRVFAPALTVAGGIDAAQWLRYGAWLAAAVSISWTITRIRRRRLQRRALSGS